MRIVGCAAADWTGDERVKARCTPRGERSAGKVRVRRGVPGATVQAELDAPSGNFQDITLDESGRGKTRFRRVTEGEHRIDLCTAHLTVDCSP